MEMLLFGCSNTDYELHLHYVKFPRELLETDPRVNHFLTIFKNSWTVVANTPH